MPPTATRTDDVTPPGADFRPIDYPLEWPPGSGRYGPNPRQELAHDLAPYADEVLYGGARGGGKTEWALAEVLRRCLRIAGLPAVIFRRTYRQLMRPSGVGPRLLARIPKRLGTFNRGEGVWTLANGSTITLAYLETAKHVQDWLGLELGLMVFEQVEQLEEEVYDAVRTSLRASGDVAAQLAEHGMRPAAIATANPGGVGHAWLKSRFVDPFPGGEQLFRASPTPKEPRPRVRVFVPARLDDNPALDQADPNYRPMLESLPDDDRRAMLEGDWNVYKGARFSSFRTARHVREPEDLRIPPLGTSSRARGADYGSSSPFVCLWGALDADGRLIVYREVWKRELTPEEQVRMIRAAEDPTEARYIPDTYLDPSTFATGPDKPGSRAAVGGGRMPGDDDAPPDGSIAWRWQQAGLRPRRGDNRRIEGAALIAQLLKDDRIVISTMCPKLIETLPALQRDPARPEDVKKGPRDHWYDALRYLAMPLVEMPRVLLPARSPGVPAPLHDPYAKPRTSPPRVPILGSPAAVPSTRGLRRRGF